MLASTALAWLLAQAPAGADVLWDAPASCPDRAALLAGIERRLARPLVGAGVDAQVRREGGEYRLRLRLRIEGRSETRELRDVSCGALVEAIAVRVAAALAPAVVPEPPPLPESVESEPIESEPLESGALELAPTPAPAPAIAPPPVAPEITPRTPPVPSRRSKKPGGILRLHGGGELGALPGPTGAVGLAGGLLWRRLRLELGAGYLAPRTAASAGFHARASLFAASVSLCARLGRGAVEVPLCGGLELGAMRGDAPGLASSRPATGLWGAALVGGGVAWHVAPRVSVWGAIGLVLAPVRPRFELSNDREVRRLFLPGPVSGRLLLGIELSFLDPW